MTKYSLVLIEHLNLTLAVAILTEFAIYSDNTSWFESFLFISAFNSKHQNK